jgi:photosystem II stability/assembly factor-like uncharacterized protein
MASAPRIAWQPQTSGVTVRLRGVSAVSATVAWASGANGTVLRTIDGGQNWQRLAVPGAEALDFRDVDAVSDRVATILSIGNGPASRIYKTTDGGAHWTLQFENTNSKAFFDAMTFRDEAHGLAFSDSVDGQLFILMTDNGGQFWRRIPADRLPPALPGEGAFAASGTNIAMHGSNRIWIGTTASRVLRSADGGRSWSVAKTPVATGDAIGIFSIAFRDAQHGVVVGGNYRLEQQAVDNVAITSDGGATWTPAQKGLSGFRSVVAFLPGAERTLIAIGPSGADVSEDDGRTWTPIEGPGFDTLSLAPQPRSAKASAERAGVGWAAGAGGRIAKIAWQ